MASFVAGKAPACPSTFIVDYWKGKVKVERIKKGPGSYAAGAKQEGPLYLHGPVAIDGHHVRDILL